MKFLIIFFLKFQKMKIKKLIYQIHKLIMELFQFLNFQMELFIRII